MSKRKNSRGVSPRRPRATDGVRLLQKAVENIESGDLAQARALATSSLEELSGDARPYHVLGIIAFQQDRLDEAISQMRQAHAIDPGYHPALNDLGNLLHEAGKYAEAVDVFQRLDRLRPNQPSTINNLGIAFKAQGRLEAAESCFARVLEVEPEHYKALLNLGYVSMARQQIPAATSHFARAAEAKPDDPEPLTVLGHLYRMQSASDDALRVYRQLLQLKPGNPVAAHMVMALEGSHQPDRASVEYVQAEFDGFADSFDEKLGELAYQGPRLLQDMLNALPADGSLRILDAGCGTGLSAPVLKPYAKQLTGVDLSNGMLDQARRTGLYDQLCQSDLESFCAATEQTFDLIVVIDTLIYLGQLEPLFRHMAAVLAINGRVVLTIESSEDPEAEFEFSPSGRFRHSRAYLQRLLTAHGLELVEDKEVVLRTENDRPVGGRAISARKTRLAPQ